MLAGVDNVFTSDVASLHDDPKPRDPRNWCYQTRIICTLKKTRSIICLAVSSGWLRGDIVRMSVFVVSFTLLFTPPTASSVVNTGNVIYLGFLT